MHLTVTFHKWGNSLGVRLPSGVAREMQLVDGDQADLTVDGGEIRLAPRRPPAHGPRQRRPLSFYEARARARGLAGMIEATEIMPDDQPRGLEVL